MRSTAAMAGDLVMMSLKPSVPERLCLMRASSPSSALVLSALRRLTCSRSTPTGLTTKSIAPARIADTTLSMPPCAVCTITGTLIRGLAQPRQHAEPVEIRHHQIEDHAIDPRAIGAAEQRQRRIAVVEHDGFIAGLLQHGLEEPALHRIVIDNEDGHLLVPSRLRCSTLCRFGSLCGRRLNGVLSRTPISNASSCPALCRASTSWWRAKERRGWPGRARP